MRSSLPSVSTPRLPLEPFGQEGIRQYFFPLLARLSLAAAIIASVFWWRSNTWSDFVSYTGGGKVIAAGSIFGRFTVRIEDATRPTGGWQIVSRPIWHFRDGWREGPLRVLGVEFGPDWMPVGAGGRTAEVWFLRIAWWWIVAAFLVMPALLCHSRVRGWFDRRRTRAVARMTGDVPAGSGNGHIARDRRKW